MPSIEARLKRQAGSRGPGFETYGVAQNPFDAGDVGWRIAPAWDCLTIGIDADRGRAVESAPPQAFVE
jgi:hypothetical protein